MKVLAEFVISAAHHSQFPKDNLPQISFCGRSNVGKSSLINTLLNRKKLARTSNTPGKTRQLNFYRITELGHSKKAFYFVDFPGYGYAKVSKAERETWRKLIEDYFNYSKTLRAAISLIDSRIGTTKSDLELLHWLHSLELPIVLIATKSDKLSKKKFAESKQQIISSVANLSLLDILMFSSETKLGRKESWKLINECLWKL